MFPILIPARGGSKRIPRKNLAEYRGTTLLGWSIRCWREFGADVFVSTEDAEIADVAAREGASVIARPSKLAGDFVGAFDVFKQALPLMPETTHVALGNCTVPEPGYEAIRKAVPNLIARQRRSAFTASKFRGFLYRFDQERGHLVSLNRPWDRRPRTQAQDVWRESGGFYLFRRDSVSLMADAVSPDSVIIPVDETVEIDTMEDLEKAYATAK